MGAQHWWKSPMPYHGLWQMSLIALLTEPTMRAAPLPNAVVPSVTNYFPLKKSAMGSP